MKEIDLNGFDVEVLEDYTLRFRLVNHRPPTNNATFKPINAKKHGANSTIEVFDLTRGSNAFRYVKTITSDAVYTPNAIAATGDGGFLVTNDHTAKSMFLLLPLLLDTIANYLLWDSAGIVSWIIVEFPTCICMLF
jgi:hypothetical protein